jgi:hypothetical protein
VDGVHVTFVDTPEFDDSTSLHPAIEGTLRNDSNQSREEGEEFIINDNRVRILWEWWERKK